MTVKKAFLSLSGIATNQRYGETKSLLCYISAIDLPSYFSVSSAPKGLELAFAEVAKGKNEKRVTALVDSIKAGLGSNRVEPFLTITAAISGKSNFSYTSRNNTGRITYSAKHAFIVDGILPTVAILRVLGFKKAFSRGFENSELMHENSQERQQLSSLMIPITVLFDDEKSLSEIDVANLCKSLNLHSFQLHSTLLDRGNTQSPLIQCVAKLADDLAFDSLGGMSNSSNRVTKSDSFITTQSTMIRLLLGAVGGASIQASTQIAQKLSNNTPIDSELLENVYPCIKGFLTAWLEGVKEKLRQNRDGFYYSTQVWQALGLVIYHLLFVSKSNDINQFATAGRVLGDLDYARNASHWANCKAMTKDINGENYKNATKGGRTFREGVAEYFVSIVC
ncbi:hypothetical protein C9J48_11025 [Photobacterium profundum]|uniref:DGQHR domain-containing protein n=1 Tax=Photobacterium profundum 3TCK TaxID=314280 RepID=Q1YWW9_9GAMM|nr:hypothetical protein [Photobacterium profundum]EAS40733.1 hypothetical protein P3TCK_08603 [Photobacterium profundum 3TCK]PSV62486.1 hypothetical protein C9J48_11025 [Photobacterium profundum]